MVDYIHDAILYVKSDEKVSVGGFGASEQMGKI